MFFVKYLQKFKITVRFLKKVSEIKFLKVKPFIYIYLLVPPNYYATFIFQIVEMFPCVVLLRRLRYNVRNSLSDQFLLELLRPITPLRLNFLIINIEKLL